MRSSLNLRGAKLRAALAAVSVAALAAVAAVIPSQIGAAASHAPRASSASRASSGAATPKPTIVLEHGAWADGSSWAGVIRRLQDHGYTVVAPPNPLRGLASDAATLADFLATLHGPIVLAGHSYGGAGIPPPPARPPHAEALPR